MVRATRTEESIFVKAIEIRDRTAREAYLKEACGVDSVLRSRVDDLLAHHFSDGRILDETTDGCMIPASLARVPKTGSRIGPYKLLQEIGEGGMGIVFMAEQVEPVRRKVAVKVIKVGMDTRRVVARFESERQALAMMEHPCITKVLDAGATDAGRPYFVMELVRGRSITTYCDDKRLSPRQRLKLFIQVCNAVEHAHQKGIIHRDIKPSNIMVTTQDGVPIPKIIDFGIAKATQEPLTEKTLFTNYGEMVGTPLYMSPEQAEMTEADVDTRTDIYSLGVLLYELITGTTPLHDLKKNSFHDICQAIRSRDPQLASTRINHLGETLEEVSRNRDTDVRSLQRFVRGELDWILAKCLARDRKDRYQSAGELASEIRRHLQGEPVEAAAPTAAYRMRKFVARHRAGVAVAALFSFVLIGSTIVSAAMAMRASRMAEQARQAEALANSRLQQVIKQRNRAVEAEQQLALLEREQRNRAAVQQAVAVHNANMVKRYLANPEAAGPHQTRIIQVKPLSTRWQMDGDASAPVSAEAPTVTGRMAMQQRVSSPVAPGAVSGIGDTVLQMDIPDIPDVPATYSFFGSDDPDNDLEIVVLQDEDETACQAELLKSLAKIQRESFGENDIVVAKTLTQLGRLMAREKNWQESQQCYKEAMTILEHMEQLGERHGPYLKQLRRQLTAALKNQANVEKALYELESAREALHEMDLDPRLDGVLDKLKSGIEAAIDKAQDGAHRDGDRDPSNP